MRLQLKLHLITNNNSFGTLCIERIVELIVGMLFQIIIQLFRHEEDSVDANVAVVLVGVGRHTAFNTQEG